jgi:hypothetical protein
MDEVGKISGDMGLVGILLIQKRCESCRRARYVSRNFAAGFVFAHGQVERLDVGEDNNSPRGNTSEQHITSILI